MKPHRDISNWFITNIRKERGRLYGDLMVEYARWNNVVYESRKFLDHLDSGTLKSIVKRIEKKLK